MRLSATLGLLMLVSASWLPAAEIDGARPLLLTFIDTSAVRGRPGGDPNRSQSVVLVSMASQYGELGLHSIVIDVTPRGTTRQQIEARQNERHDWSLTELLVIADPEQELARAFSIDSFPATVLLDDGGRAAASWSGFAPALEVGPALRGLFYGPGSLGR